jgi:hypothetical protein
MKKPPENLYFFTKDIFRDTVNFYGDFVHFGGKSFQITHLDKIFV